jgi:REP element-mobilizing transposase RayT
MSAYNPHIHHRRSIRLKGFDYSREGLYFVTICVQNRACLFGNVENGEMIMNDMGRMVEKWYVENVGTSVGAPVGADLRVCPDDTCVCPDDLQGEHIGSPLHVCPDDLQGEHIGSPLHGVVQWFKTMTTNEYIRGVKTLGWPPFNGKLWQRNYHEHIIRNEQSYQTILEYIINNPAKWAVDKFYMH